MANLAKCLHKFASAHVIWVNAEAPIRSPCWRMHRETQSLYSLSGKTSCSQSLKAARFGVIMIVSLWNLTGISAALQFQGDWKGLNPNLAAPRFDETLRFAPIYHICLYTKCHKNPYWWSVNICVWPQTIYILLVNAWPRLFVDDVLTLKISVITNIISLFAKW